MKTSNLRFLLALGGTKIVALQDEEDLHVYSKTIANFSDGRLPIPPEHVAEALTAK